MGGRVDSGRDPGRSRVATGRIGHVHAHKDRRLLPDRVGDGRDRVAVGSRIGRIGLRPRRGDERVGFCARDGGCAAEDREGAARRAARRSDRVRAGRNLYRGQVPAQES